jgi:16S rRNA (guanine527-N7)-methyltransferase
LRVRKDLGLLPHIRGGEDFAAAFAVSRQAIARLECYAALLRQWQRAVNLVAASTLDDIWHRHFADCAQLLPLVRSARSLVDLGSGGGFPGLVLAILWADIAEAPAPPATAASAHPLPGETTVEATGRRRVSLVESNARKSAFLAEVVAHTGIRPRIAVDILSTRGEEAATQATLRGAEVVAARAVAPLDRLLGLAAPLFSPDTVGVFLKGRDAAAELEIAQQMWNFRVEMLPSRTASDGHIVVIRHPAAKARANRDRRTARG